MNTVEQAHSLSIFYLKEVGFFNANINYRSSITWSSNGQETGSVGFFISVRNMYIRLLYKVTMNSTDKSLRIKYKISLLKTLCHYGGGRYWFQCPDCHRRAGVLYIHIYPKCRKCSGLTYESQRASRLNRLMGSKGYEYMLDKERRSMRITHYRGKPTKRYLQYLKRSEKSATVLSWVMSRLSY